MKDAMTDQVSYDPEYDNIVKIQSFVRGSLCRAKVSEMVKRLIDDILLERAEKDATFTKKTGHIGDVEDDASSINLMDNPPDDVKENFGVDVFIA